MITILYQFRLIVFVLLTMTLSYAIAQENKVVNLAEASEYVRKNENGKVLSAKTISLNGVKVHRIQVLTKTGRVKVYQVPTRKISNHTHKSGKHFVDRQFRSIDKNIFDKGSITIRGNTIKQDSITRRNINSSKLSTRSRTTTNRQLDSKGAIKEK